MPEARYEAAYQFPNKRSYLPSGIQDARLDASPGVRREIMRLSRYWEQNNAFINRMLDLFETFTVGATGLHIVPNSSDDAWNEAAAAWWREWCQQPARDNFQPLGSLQSLMARCWFVDGEIFLNKTSDPSTKRPAIQLIESHRVETPGELGQYEGDTIIDGVDVDTAGRPLSYRVRQTDKSIFYGANSLQGAMQSNYSPPGTYKQIAAENMIHIFEPVRPGLTRGMPMIYPIEHDLHDLDDLQDMEMQKAKENARTAKVVKTKTGEAPTSQDKYRLQYQINSQNAAGGAVVKNVPQYYQLTQGGDVVYMMPGEDMQEFRSDQPSAATQSYWDTLIGKACIGIGIPRTLVVPYRIQGAALRADIETAAAYFRARSAVVAFAMQNLYRWAVGWGVDFDRSLKGAPKDWDNVVIRPPRGVNVDIGRNSTALINEMNAGIRTLADICNELGLDWREVLKQRGKEAKFINDLAAKLGIPREQIAEFAKGSQPPVEQPEEEDDEEEETTPSKNGKTSARFNFRTNGHNHHLV